MFSSTVSAPMAWIHRVAVASVGSGDMEVADQLLDHVEAEFAERGARKVASAVTAGSGVRHLLERRGYAAPPDVSWRVSVGGSLGLVSGRSCRALRPRRNSSSVE
jgi:hypothetical protein